MPTVLFSFVTLRGDDANGSCRSPGRVQGYQWLAKLKCISRFTKRSPLWAVLVGQGDLPYRSQLPTPQRRAPPPNKLQGQGVVLGFGG